VYFAFIVKVFLPLINYTTFFWFRQSLFAIFL